MASEAKTAKRPRSPNQRLLADDPYRLTEESGLAAPCSWRTRSQSSLTHHAPMEQLDASPEAEDERGAERQHDPANRKRLRRWPRYGRNHGVPHALGGVGER